MANPVSKGIGTGAAQVFDVSRMDRAMNKAFDTINAKKAQEEKDRIAQKKLDDAGKGKLKGQFEDLDYSKVMLGDQKVLADEVTNEMSRFDGHWGEILSGDPKWSNEYRKSMAGLKSKINTSAISKPLADAQLAKMKEPDSGYSEEAIENYMRLKSQPGYNHDEMLQTGGLNRDQIIGSMMGNTKKAFPDMNAFYDFKDSSGKNTDGSGYDVVSQEWKDDATALEQFNSVVQSSPSLGIDRNIQYKDVEGWDQMSEEQKNKVWYDDFKKTNDVSKKSTSYTQKDEDDGAGGAGYNNEVYNITVKSDEREIKRGSKKGDTSEVTKGNAVVNFAKKTGAAITPIVIDGTRYVVEGVKRKNGKLILTGGYISDEIDVEDSKFSFKGTREEIPWTNHISNQINASFDIKDMNKFIDDQLNRGTATTEDAAAQAKALIDKYKKK